jgi:hypothetical protein
LPHRARMFVSDKEPNYHHISSGTSSPHYT